MKLMMGFIMGLILIGATIYVLFLVTKSSEKADVAADRVFGKMDDVYRTKKTLIQKPIIYINGKEGKYSVVKSEVDKNGYSKTQQIVQDKHTKKVQQTGGDKRITVNVIANQQDYLKKTAKTKDKFDQEWDSFDKTFKEKQGEW